ncbi:MAG: tRNA 5-methoxyuridine(34)/uridine 5-oxyacetic acid(34) synthase CmoB [Gammaproteobacteria bacterium]|nr:tRNA 5-methoxyuridine(34)/uridine 5-oxyacetic acid(34) synthase CmoB [Gammaproteobacteria bacterium]
MSGYRNEGRMGRRGTAQITPATLGKRGRSSHDRAMGLNHEEAALSAFLDRSTHALTTAFAELPASAQAWLVDALRHARSTLAGDGRMAEWQAALAALPVLAVEARDYGACPRAAGPCDDARRAALYAALMALAPWRKGPFEVFGIRIDSEWRSDWKWARVLPHLASLEGRRVLDVGCGNGYYLWRMAEAGAALALGIDPALAACTQFAAVARYLACERVHMLPLASAALDERLRCFDTVFSMGVLYHRRDHLVHLRELHCALRAGGELLLETLVIADGSTELLVPAARYAAMRNVWAVPAPATVEQWLAETGFRRARMVDLTPTTVAEQRSTPWMPYHSLQDFLAVEDSTRTIEGYPAPQRAVFVASVD